MCPRLLEQQLLPSGRALHRGAQLLAQLAQRPAACHAWGSQVQHCGNPLRLLRQQGKGGVLLQLGGCHTAVQVGQQQQLVGATQVAHETKHLLLAVLLRVLRGNLPLLLSLPPAAGLLLPLLGERRLPAPLAS